MNPSFIVDAEFKALIPPLSHEEHSQLEANILAEGCRDALVVWNTLLLDGHNRFAICQKHSLPFAATSLELPDRQAALNWIINNQLGRRNLHPDQASYLRGKRYNGEKASVGGDRGNQYTVAKDQNDPLPESTADRLATEYKVSAPTVKRDGNYAAAIDTLQAAGIAPQSVIAHEPKAAVVEFAKLITPEPAPPAAPLLPVEPPKPKDPVVAAVTEKVKRGEMTVVEAAKEIRQAKTEQRREERLEKIVEISQGNTELSTDIRYPVLYADPPWRYEHAESDSRAIENQYPTMALEDICALPVADLATPDAILFLWATSPKLAESMRVIESWGFTYRTCAVWSKAHPSVDAYEHQNPCRQGYSREAYLYIAGFTVKEISDLMGRSESTIRYFLHRQGIHLDLHRSRINRAAVSERQMEIIDGEMLGDGCLALGKRNISARLQWNLKKLGHVELLANEFSEFDPVYKRRSDRDGWRLHTKVNSDLTTQNFRWYKDGVKRVPEDVIISPISCFHWYIGDGYLNASGGIELYTFGFPLSDVELIVSKLSEHGIIAKILERKGKGYGYYIALGKEQANKFLVFIGHCRVPDYAYKWGNENRALIGSEQIGCGYYFRQRHELLLVATRGSIPTPAPGDRAASVIVEPREEHSAKPTKFAELIEAMYPTLPRIELFCRSPREGWAVWGNQSC